MYGIMYYEVYRSCTNTFLIFLYLIALDELAGGTAADYSNHVFITNDYLVSHIVNTLIDREIVNQAAVKLIMDAWNKKTQRFILLLLSTHSLDTCLWGESDHHVRGITEPLYM